MAVITKFGRIYSTHHHLLLLVLVHVKSPPQPREICRLLLPADRIVRFEREALRFCLRKIKQAVLEIFVIIQSD